MKNVQLLSLQTHAMPREHQLLCTIFSELFADIPPPLRSLAPDRLLDRLSDGLRRHQTFIIAAEPAQFLALKAALLEGLGLTPHVRPHILKLQRDPSAEDAAFPIGAEAFLSGDGRENGFALRRGKQDIIVVPLCCRRLTEQREQIAAHFAGAVLPSKAPQKSCALLLSPAWAEVASLLRDLDSRLPFNVMACPEAAAIIRPEDALQLAERYLLGGEHKYCAVVSSPLPGPSAGARVIVGLNGPGQRAQTQMIALSQGLAAAELTEALLRLLREQLHTESAPSQTKRRGPALSGPKLRAMIAACLTAITIAGSVLFTMQGGSTAAEQGYQPIVIGQTIERGRAEASAEQTEAVEHRVAADVLGSVEVSPEQLVPNALVPVNISSLIPSVPGVSGLVGLLTSGVNIFGNVLSWIVQTAGSIFNRAPDIHPPAQQPPTTQPPAQQPPTTQPPTQSPNPATRGTFHLAVAGFGHGVGMSQMGAIALARQGWTAEQILLHYYYDSRVSIATHRNRPSHVTHVFPSGETRRVEMFEYIARITYREIGTPNNVPREAMIAQMIAAYTIAKRNNFRTTENNHHILNDTDWNSNWARQFHEPMLAMAREAAGRYISFNGSVANALYFASSAGHTASAQWAWSGHTPSAYLTGGRWSPETVDRSTPSFTSDQIRTMVNDYNRRFPNNRITLGSDASQWIRVLRTCPHGYVEQVQIGDRTFTGGNARMHFFGSRNVRSHHFSVNFVAG